MNKIKTIPLRDLPNDLEKLLTESADSGVAVVVELPDRRRVAIQPLDEGDADDLVDSLIASSSEFRAAIEASKVSPRKPFTG